MKSVVDIVLPCYNPAPGWQKELVSFHNKAKEIYNLRFIVVNDGSNQDFDVAGQVQHLDGNGIPTLLITYGQNMGKGYALRKGVAAATAPVVVYTDVDFPFTDDSMLELLKALTGNSCDIAIGYRADSYYKENMPVWRRFLSRSFRFFISRVLGMRVTDTQCGLKGFNDKGKKTFLATTVNRYLFDFEFIYTAGRNRSMRLETVEVKLKENIVFSRMRLKVLAQELFNLLRVLLFRRSLKE